jgi:hypothetical protein
MRIIGSLHKQNRWGITAFAMFVCLLACGLSLRGQAKSGSKKHIPLQVSHTEKKAKETSMRLTLEVDKYDVSISGGLGIKVSIGNAGSNVAYLLRDFYWGSGSLKLIVLDNSGVPLPPEPIDDVLPPPPSEKDPACLVRLNTGEFFGVTRSIRVKDKFKTAGTYRVRAEYNCWLPEGVITDEAVSREKVLWKQPEPLVSEEVVIRVK